MIKAKRYFNTSGPNIPIKHYTLLREKLVEKGKKMVEDERYFTIWAPRQTGKSTYFRLLAQELEKEDYRVCYLNVENFRNAPIRSMLDHFYIYLQEFWGIDFRGQNIQDIFNTIATIKDKKLVLIIDEVEGATQDYLGDLLHSIRNAYHSRQFHSLKSVILVGVSNITGIVQDNASPFNVSDNLEIPYFSKAEVFALLGQHEKETGQLFSEEVKEKIAYITAGQPGLVNGFGLKLTTACPEKPQIGYEDYLKAEDDFLHKSLDKNVANIVNKAKEHRAFVEKLLFTESRVAFTVYNEQVRYLHTNGLLKEDENGNVEFWVPLYKKCLQQYFYPSMNGESEEIQRNIVVNSYFTEAGLLNLDKVLRDYQVYTARRGFRYFIEKDTNNKPKGMLEAGLMYSFETYIQSFLQVLKGKSYLEPHVALGRSDLIINIRGQEFVIEGKIYYNISRFIDGKTQLAYYIKSLGLRTGIYLVFVNSKVSNPEIVESMEIIENVEISTYIVPYDLEKDFSEPRKNNL